MPLMDHSPMVVRHLTGAVLDPPMTLIGGFTRAVGSKDSRDEPTLTSEVDIVDGDRIFIEHHQIMNRQNGHLALSFPRYASLTF